VDTDSQRELERLRRELAEARRESDARAAELRKLHEETRQFRQWRADLYLLLKSKKDSPLWRALSVLRNAKKSLVGGAGGDSLLDDFMPPPLEAAQTAHEPRRTTRPLPPLFTENRSGICFHWNDATPDATTPERTTFTIGSPTSDAPALRFCDSLITRDHNGLASLRKIIQGTPPGAEIWITEPDAANLPNVEPATIQHLLLDETEPKRERGPHAVDRRLFSDVIKELTASGDAEWLDTWSQSNAQSLHHLAVLRRTCPPNSAPKSESDSKTAAAPTSRTPGATLVLLHANPFAFGAGGTEQIVLVRTQAMALPRTVLVFPNGPREIVAAEVLNGDINQRRTHTFPLRNPLAQYTIENREVEDLVLWLARQFGVTSAIIDHLMNWPLLLPLYLKKTGVSYAMVLHDFYVICPSFNLLDARTNTRCATHLDGAAKDDCSEQCLASHFAAHLHSPSPRTLARHQETMQTLIGCASTIIYPDASVQKRFKRSLPAGDPREIYDANAGITIPDKIIPHGMDSAPATIHEMRGPRLRLALLGNLNSPTKGSLWLGEILERARTLPIDWHIFGRYDGEFAETPNGATLTRHGPYERAQIIGLLKTHAADVTLFTSIVEESFSLTLSESFSAGVPAIAPDLGALGERVRSSGFGWTVPVGDSSAVLALLQRLSANPAERNAVASKLIGFKHFSTQENANAFKGELAALFNHPAPAPLAARSQWLERAANYERELAQAFDASRDERWALPGKAGEAAAATLTISSVRFSREQRHVLMLDVSSSIRDTLQVFYGTLAAPLMSASQCVRHALEAGRNRIWIEVSHPLLDGGLEVRFAMRPGHFTLHDAKLRAV